MLILCAFLCACTGKTEFSESFICGEAEAYAVCEEGLLTASASSVKCFDGAGEKTLDRELEVKPARIVKNGSIAAAYARGGTSIVFPDGGVIETDNGIRDVQLSDGGYLAVCTEQPGYMGSVTVYSPERERVQMVLRKPKTCFRRRFAGREVPCGAHRRGDTPVLARQRKRASIVFSAGAARDHMAWRQGVRHRQ